MSGTIRIAAAGDVHASEALREHLSRAFAAIVRRSISSCSPATSTTHGLPEQASVLADACAGLPVPVVAVLGNHDHHSGHATEVAVLRTAGSSSSTAGTFSSSASSRSASSGRRASSAVSPAPRFRTSESRRCVRSTTRLARGRGSEVGLEEIAGCHKRIVLLHYAPITDTIVGEPEGIWAFLGSSRLAGPIGMHRPELVVHGHAHHGAPQGRSAPFPCTTSPCT